MNKILNSNFYTKEIYCSINPEAFPEEDGFKRISLTYSDHCFIICLSNKKIHVVKKALKQQHSTAGDTSAKVNA